MFRITGFVVGSALAITAMLVVLGMPQLPSSKPDSEPELVPEPIALQPLAAPEDTQVQPAPELAPQIVVPVEPIAAESRWHSFWSPFHSQIAANGFIGQLEAVTGYDYRVVKIETGVYEVTFSYVDEAERRDKLSVIASATGLELPDS